MSEGTIAIPHSITVKELSERLEVPVTDLVAEFMKNGVMATINDSVDFETAAIVAEDLGFSLTEETAAEQLSEAVDRPQLTVLEPGEGEPRPPVVCVMGHVDHGKTTLLDAIKGTDIAAGEAGGITQHISAYQITHNDRLVTFLDTPGHEAFGILREHGARLTDVAIIVIAADDGIKPQTEEAIRYAQDAGVRMVIAVNKIDKPDADPNRVRQQLADLNLIPEDWSGETVVVDVSAEQSQHIDQLLDMVFLVADLEDLRARPDGDAEGTVIEAQMQRGQGAVATVLMQHGQLNVGDTVVAGDVWGKVRSLEDFTGQRIKTAGPSQPVAVSGWKDTPSLGAFIYEVGDEKAARIASTDAAEAAATTSGITQAEALTAAMNAGAAATVPVVVKADVDGSLTSLVQSIELLGHAEVRPEVIGRGVGPVTESDVALAESTGAQIIGFNVNVPGRVKQLALRAQVEIKLYRVIYELLDDLREQLNALLAPEVIEETVGKLRVKGIFKTAQKELIAGGEVLDGKLIPGALVRFVDGDEIGTLESLQREQQAAKQLNQGETGGLSIATKRKVKLSIDDELEFFTREERERSI